MKGVGCNLTIVHQSRADSWCYKTYRLAGCAPLVGTCHLARSVSSCAIKLGLLKGSEFSIILSHEGLILRASVNDYTSGTPEKRSTFSPLQSTLNCLLLGRSVVFYQDILVMHWTQTVSLLFVVCWTIMRTDSNPESACHDRKSCCFQEQCPVLVEAHSRLS